MKGLKERGMQRELLPLIKRVKRAYAMGRIDRPTFLELLEHLEKVEALIIECVELDETGEEVISGHT